MLKELGLMYIEKQLQHMAYHNNGGVQWMVNGLVICFTACWGCPSLQAAACQQGISLVSMGWYLIQLLTVTSESFR